MLKRIRLFKELQILSKKDWTLYAVLNLGMVIVCLGVFLWSFLNIRAVMETTNLLTEEQSRYLQELELKRQTLESIQNTTGLDEAIALKIWEQANEYEALTVDLITAVMFVESSYNPKAVSHAGAIGIMQIMPKTGEWLAGILNKPFQLDMLYDPLYNIELGCYFLADLIDRYGDLHTALTAYNRGERGLEIYQEAHQKSKSSYSSKIVNLLNP